MFNKSSDKPSGYDYPRPTIDRGQTQAPQGSNVSKLSQENVEKVRKMVRDQQSVRPAIGK